MVFENLECQVHQLGWAREQRGIRHACLRYHSARFTQPKFNPRHFHHKVQQQPIQLRIVKANNACAGHITTICEAGRFAFADTVNAYDWASRALGLEQFPLANRS